MLPDIRQNDYLYSVPKFELALQRNLLLGAR